LIFQYKKTPLINLNQAFGMNPINFTDPMGLDVMPHREHVDWFIHGGGYKPATLKDVDRFLTDISTNTQYMVQGGINLVLGGAQWLLHQANAFWYSLSGVDYYSYDLVNYQFDFDNPAGIFRTVDTRPSAEKALGMAGLDSVKGLYYWGKSGIMLLNPNLSEEESRAYKKTFFGGIPGVSLLAYGGYRFFSKGFVKNKSSISYLRKKYNITSREQLRLKIDELTGKNYQRLLDETIANNEYSFRYLSEEGLSKTLTSGKVRGYMTDRFTYSSSEAAKGVQIMSEWGVPKYGVAIPNTKLLNFRVARPYGNTGKFGWELVTNSYPKAGSGHWLQFLGEAALEDVFIFPLKR